MITRKRQSQTGSISPSRLNCIVLGQKQFTTPQTSLAQTRVWKSPSSSLALKWPEFCQTERERLEVQLLETHVEIPGSTTGS